MAINFPNSPNVNDVFTVSNVLYNWDGTAWRSNGQGFTGGTITGTLFVNNVTGATSTTTGALQVAGGVGVGGGVVIGGISTITNTTQASSTTTGALQVAGGIGVGGNIIFGGEMTGRVKGYSLTTNALGNVSGNKTIDLSLGNYVTGTTTGATTWTFTATVASPNAVGFVLELTNGGSAAQTWPTTAKWPAGTAPTLTAAGVDVLAFISDDGGATWRGVASMLDSK